MTRELIVRRVIPVLALVIATVFACREATQPMAPHAGAGKLAARSRHGIPIPYTIQCHGRRSKRTFSCAQAVPKLAGREKFMPRVTTRGAAATRARGVVSKDVVIGGSQGQYITLTTSNYAFDTISNIFSLDATVQNDLGEPLGTPGGSTVTGIKVFVSALYVTAGSGAIYIANPDGTGTFTATNQPYWLYNQMLAPQQVSNSRNWQIYLAPAVDNFFISIETYAGFPAEFTIPAAAPDTTVDSIYASSNVTNSDPNYAGPHLFNAVTVDFARDTSIGDRALAVAAIGGTVVGGWDYINNDGFYVIRIPGDSTGAGLAAAISTLESLPQVATASPEFILDSNALEYRRPRDHFQPSDWHWNPDNPGVDTTWAFSRVEAPLAWGCDTGSTTTQVAVVDNNFPQVTDIDTNAVGTAWTPFASVKSNHGVAMTSIIGAQGNNGIGMAGMMWRARLRLYEVGVTIGDEWTPERAISEIARAAEDGARVINISQNAGFGILYAFGTKADSTNGREVAAIASVIAELDTAMLRADSIAPQNPVYVVSAGNESVGNDRTNPWWNVFPTLATLFSGRGLVAEWTNSQDNRGDGANSGQYVNIAAPGDSVMKLNIDGTVGLVSGSSPSAALVTGTVGLLFAFDSSMSSTSAVSYIIQGAINGGRHTNDATPVPILNAYESLKLVAAQSGAPLCGNRLWSSGGFIYAQRGNGATEAIASTGGAPAWNVIAMHGGHRIEFTTVHGRYSAVYRDGSWQSPIQVQDSITAATEAPSYGGGPGVVPQNGNQSAADSLLGGAGWSVWGVNHDGDSAVTAVVHQNWGSYPTGIDTVFVIKGRTPVVFNDSSGPLDTVGTIAYPSAQYVIYPQCTLYQDDDVTCIGNAGGLNRIDFIQIAYAPRGDRVLVAISQDTIHFQTLATQFSCGTGEFICQSWQSDVVPDSTTVYQLSLPSQPNQAPTLMTTLRGTDVWWLGQSEADSTIVAGVGPRDYRIFAYNTGSGQADFGTGCTVDFRPGNFGVALLSEPTSDACVTDWLGEGPVAQFGSGSISPNRVSKKRKVSITNRPPIIRIVRRKEGKKPISTQ